MINQHKINMAIDERIDRIDAFYKKRIDKLQDNNIYLDKKIRELETNQLNLQELSTKLCYKLDKVDKRLDELEAQERAHTQILEITSDEIEDLQSAQEESEAKDPQLEIISNELDEAIKYIQTLQDRIIKIGDKNK